MHVNAFFELSSNRRDVWHGADLAGAGAQRAAWNLLLLEQVRQAGPRPLVFDVTKMGIKPYSRHCLAALNLSSQPPNPLLVVPHCEVMRHWVHCLSWDCHRCRLPPLPLLQPTSTAVPGSGAALPMHLSANLSPWLSTVAPHPVPSRLATGGGACIRSPPGSGRLPPGSRPGIQQVTSPVETSSTREQQYNGTDCSRCHFGYMSGSHEGSGLAL